MYREIGENHIPRVLTNEQNNQNDMEKQHLSSVNFLNFFLTGLACRSSGHELFR